MAAVVSPKGGVGKTTCTFVIGNLLADRLRLRVVAVDANPDFGTLAALAPDRLRCAAHAGRPARRHRADPHRRRAARLRVGLPSGLHLLGAPADAAADGRARPGGLRRAARAAGHLLRPGAARPRHRRRRRAGPVRHRPRRPGRARHHPRVGRPAAPCSPRSTTSSTNAPPWPATSSTPAGPATCANSSDACANAACTAAVAIPYDDQLAGMLDTATYQLDALERTTRTAIKRLGLNIHEQLV